MKKQILLPFYYLLLSIVSISLLACSSDDDDTPVKLEDDIIGKWHSYKLVGRRSDGSETTLNMSKTGTASEVYIELSFLKGGKGSGYHWELGENNLSQWKEYPFTYSVGNNTVTLYDDEVETLNFDEKSQNLYLRGVYTIDYGEKITAYIYFKK